MPPSVCATKWPRRNSARTRRPPSAGRRAHAAAGPIGEFFEAKQGVEGDISKVVGSASDKPIPSAPKKIEPKGTTGEAGKGGHTGSLLEAKRLRAAADGTTRKRRIAIS